LGRNMVYFCPSDSITPWNTNDPSGTGTEGDV
jgi:hypothetical protein